MKTPVLLITFNRPEYTAKMVKALKKAKIENLYVFKDGPRPNNESDIIASRRIEDIISAIDWDCDVKTLYLNNNLGCGYGPYTAISWIFGIEDEAIILEDDCIPTEAFFDFCIRMLEKYRDNPKVRHISGRSPYQEHEIFTDYDYIFSQYAPTIGWATWKRTWKNFDLQMRNLYEFFETGGFSNQFSSKDEVVFFNKRFASTLKDHNAVFHIWDYHYGLHSRINGSLGIVPSHNLINYIGVEGTHPTTEDSEIVQLKSHNDFIGNKCPTEISFINAYDTKYFKRFIQGETRIWKRVINKIYRLVK